MKMIIHGMLFLLFIVTPLTTFAEGGLYGNVGLDTGYLLGTGKTATGDAFTKGSVGYKLENGAYLDVWVGDDFKDTSEVDYTAGRKFVAVDTNWNGKVQWYDVGPQKGFGDTTGDIGVVSLEGTRGGSLYWFGGAERYFVQHSPGMSGNNIWAGFGWNGDKLSVRFRQKHYGAIGGVDATQVDLSFKLTENANLEVKGVRGSDHSGVTTGINWRF